VEASRALSAGSTASWLRAGAFLLADNANCSPDYLARVRSSNGGYLSIPFADDVELSMRLDAPSGAR
jgi:hypothetical protein